MRRQELHPRTAVINKAQKNISKKIRSEALLWLAKVFPLAFDNSLQIRPLKVGIMHDIWLYIDKEGNSGISKSKLREAVVLFTRRIDYLTCLKAREMRIDLEGKEVSMVTEEESEKAIAKINKRIEKAVRNARKNPVGKASTHHAKQGAAQGSSFLKQASVISYSTSFEKETVFHSSKIEEPLSPTSNVIVKHKTSRQFDPDMVARLKEKLGLRKVEIEKEFL